MYAKPKLTKHSHLRQITFLLENPEEVDRIIEYEVKYSDGESTRVFADSGKKAQAIAKKMRPDATVQSTTNKN